MSKIFCEHGCGAEATYQTKGSLTSGPFGGKPVWQCCKSHNSCPAVKERKIQSSIKKYGTEYPWQTTDVMEKRNKTNIDRYGNKFSLKGQKQAEQRTSTMLKKYGVMHPTLNEEIKIKASASIKQSYIDDPTLAKRQLATKYNKYGPNLTAIVDKCRTTQIAIGRWVDPTKMTEWQKYKKSVRYYTMKTYKQYKELINPNDLPIGVCEYQIDHIYSIRHGFEHNISPEIIGHKENLRILWHVENKSKHIRSDITIEELIKKIKGD